MNDDEVLNKTFEDHEGNREGTFAFLSGKESIMDNDEAAIGKDKFADIQNSGV